MSDDVAIRHVERLDVSDQVAGKRFDDGSSEEERSCRKKRRRRRGETRKHEYDSEDSEEEDSRSRESRSRHRRRRRDSEEDGRHSRRRKKEEMDESSDERTNRRRRRRKKRSESETSMSEVSESESDDDTKKRKRKERSKKHSSESEESDLEVRKEKTSSKEVSIEVENGEKKADVKTEPGEEDPKLLEEVEVVPHEIEKEEIVEAEAIDRVEVEPPVSYGEVLEVEAEVHRTEVESETEEKVKVSKKIKKKKQKRRTEVGAEEDEKSKEKEKNGAVKPEADPESTAVQVQVSSESKSGESQSSEEKLSNGQETIAEPVVVLEPTDEAFFDEEEEAEEVEKQTEGEEKEGEVEEGGEEEEETGDGEGEEDTIGAAEETGEQDEDDTKVEGEQKKDEDVIDEQSNIDKDVETAVAQEVETAVGEEDKDKQMDGEEEESEHVDEDTEVDDLPTFLDRRICSIGDGQSRSPEGTSERRSSLSLKRESSFIQLDDERDEVASRLGDIEFSIKGIRLGDADGRSTSMGEDSGGSTRNGDSSVILDSGIEPSPRRERKIDYELSAEIGEDSPPRRGRVQRLCRKGKEEEPPLTSISVTRAVQNTIRKYHLERSIFYQLLELKRLQIRAGRANEHVMVKRLVDEYKRAGLVIGLKQYGGNYTFRQFETYLYDQLHTLQSSGHRMMPKILPTDDIEKLSSILKKTKAELLENIPSNPILCTHGTHRCHHAAHAYTGIPCAAYITKLNHHQMPKPRSSGFLPRIDPSPSSRPTSKGYSTRPVTLELTHGLDKQIISLPTDRLDRNKRYYVTFTIKGGHTTPVQDARTGETPSEDSIRHRHAKTL